MPPKSENIKDLRTEIKLLYQIVEIINFSENLSELLHQTARLISENLKGDSCLIYILERNTKMLVLSGAWPPHPYHIGKLRIEAGAGITGWVASHKKPIAINKSAFNDSRFKMFQNLPEDKFEAFLSVPIILDGQTIGVINLQNRKSRKFSENLLKLLISIASQISGAIEKMKLLETAALKAKQIGTIAQLSNSIVSNKYINEILQLIVTMTAQMMNSKICSLMLFDEEKQELKIEATQSLSEDYRRKPPLKVGQSISGQVIKEKKTIAVLDVTKAPGYGYPQIAEKEGLRSMIAVPMMIKDKPIGVINCYTVTEHVFTNEEIDILQTIANQSAVAIENTRLLEESRTAREALETRKIIERAKGILMKERNLNEEEAFGFIQRQAMNLRRNMREIADAILLSEGLKKK